MPEFRLAPTTPLGGFQTEIGGTVLAEVADLSLVSLATPLDGEAALATACRAAWGVAPPEIGTSAKGEGVTLLALAQDQRLALLPRAPGLAAPDVAEALGGAAYVTEQTDAWAMLRLSGPLTLAALERICPLDLAGFGAGAVARTLMEHLGVVILREGAEAFLLLSASSSAGSFRHAVEQSLKNVA